MESILLPSAFSPLPPLPPSGAVSIYSAFSNSEETRGITTGFLLVLSMGQIQLGARKLRVLCVEIIQPPKVQSREKSMKNISGRANRNLTANPSHNIHINRVVNSDLRSWEAGKSIKQK